MLTADRLAHDGHVLSRGIIAHLTHPAIGETEAIGMPWRIDGERPAARAAPLLGQHNPWALGELLGEHGGGIDQLSKAGALT
jgi:crotonobetainyl-CoA:carnitine CoA-transferase CaiB-like acyl-CoA transferase